MDCPDCGQRIVVPLPEEGVPTVAHGESPPGEGVSRLPDMVQRRRAAEPATETEAGAEPDALEGLLRTGEGSLAGGIALLGVAALLLQQVIIGLLGLILAPVVLALLFRGVLRASDPDLPRGRQVVGFLLLLLALGGLVMTTGLAVETSARAARLTQIREDRMRALQHGNPSSPLEDPAAAALRQKIKAELENLSRHPAHAPPERRRVAGAVSWLAPVFMGLGLFCRAGWPLWRCLVWAGLVWVFPDSLARLIHAFGSWMALSA